MTEREPSPEFEHQVTELSRRILRIADALTGRETESPSGIRRTTYKVPDSGGPVDLSRLVVEYATESGEGGTAAVHSARLVLFGENISSDTTNGVASVLTSELGDLEYIAGEELSNMTSFEQPETTQLLVRKVDRFVKWLSQTIVQDALEYADED